MQRIIELIISPRGETTLQTKGYAGTSCQQASRFLEQALGITATDRPTAEYYQSTPIEQRVQQ